jgi:hypothetical protein
MNNSPPHNLVVVVVGIVEGKDDPSQVPEGRVHKDRYEGKDDLGQVPEGRVHKDRYFHSLVNNMDSLVGHVVVLIFRGIVHRRVVDELWLMGLS